MVLPILFVDLNAFFASVEQQERPELRGRPVVVAPVDAESTCCIAASYQARRVGIKTGTLVSEARRLCPQVVVVRARPEIYVHFHHRILAAVETCLPVEQVWSIDEMHCRLTGGQEEPGRAVAIARRMKLAIRQFAGDCLTCSIGLASNRMLAKVASDMQKPDGLVCLEPSGLPGSLFGLKLTDFPGIGPRMERRLAGRGIHTVEHLCSLSEKALIAAWGSIVGRDWWHWLRGLELTPPPTRRRSIGHEHVLEPALRRDEGARAVLVRLVQKAAARARDQGYLAGRLCVHVKLLEGGYWDDRIDLSPPTHDTLRLVGCLVELWDRRLSHGWRGRPLRVGIVLTNLEPAAGATLPLFGQDRRLTHLSAAMDRVNRKFGRDSVYLACMQGVRKAAPMRIAFGSVPDMKV